MSRNQKNREVARARRRKRVRDRVVGTNDKPRLCVFRSNLYTYAQLISDEDGRVLVAASTKGGDGKSLRNVESAKSLGMKVAELAKAKNIETVVFDRNGYVYHGRIAAVAQGARDGGLQF